MPRNPIRPEKINARVTSFLPGFPKLADGFDFAQVTNDFDCEFITTHIWFHSLSLAFFINLALLREALVCLLRVSGHSPGRISQRQLPKECR